jgi:Ca2+-binding RTX toxin-like protein
VVSGGAGTDTANFINFGVSVSLDNVANDGQPGQNQNIQSDVENINGSSGNDVLTGGPGFNVINGNAGDDVINVRDGGGDLVFCAAGFDVLTADGADAVDGSQGPCEVSDFGNLAGFGPVVGASFAKKAGKTVKATLTCPLATNGFCSGAISLAMGKKSAGSATFFLQAGESEVESIDLSRAARKKLEDKGKLKITATISASDGRGATGTSSKDVTLKG